MKKITALIVTGMLTCSLPACSNHSNQDAVSAETEINIETNESVEETANSNDTSDISAETEVDDEVAEAEAEEIDLVD